MTKDNIHTGHRQRIRKQVCENGFDGYSDHQILEVLLTYVIPYKDTNPIAHALIGEFGNLAGVFEASVSDLIKVEGIGEKTAIFLSTMPNLFEAYSKSKMAPKEVLDSPAKIVNYFKRYVTVVGKENFYFACLDGKSGLICLEKLGNGQANSINVNIREFTQKVLQHPTESVVICHTHTAPDPLPSREDIMFTQRICDSLGMLGVSLVDHIIIAPDTHFSFVNAHLLGDSNESKIRVLNSASLGMTKTSYHEDK